MRVWVSFSKVSKSFSNLIFHYVLSPVFTINSTLAFQNQIFLLSLWRITINLQPKLVMELLNLKQSIFILDRKINNATAIPNIIKRHLLFFLILDQIHTNTILCFLCFHPFFFFPIFIFCFAFFTHIIKLCLWLKHPATFGTGFLKFFISFFLAFLSSLLFILPLTDKGRKSNFLYLLV